MTKVASSSTFPVVKQRPTKKHLDEKLSPLTDQLLDVNLILVFQGLDFFHELTDSSESLLQALSLQGHCLAIELDFFDVLNLLGL